MRYQQLGKTGLTISELGFGGIPIMRLPLGDAVSVLHRAYDRGITFYDTANAYGRSEEFIGAAFADRRDKVVIATKTMKRDAAGAAEQLDNSLRMLRTDYIDLYQFHQLFHERDWQTIIGPGGAMETARKAQEQGKIRHLGVTSHNLSMAIKLVKTGLFATVQFPFSFLEPAAADELHVAARGLGLGILAMKPFGGGVIDNAALSFKFLRQHPDVVVIPGYDSVASVDEIVALYDKSNVVTAEDLALMDRYRDELGRRFCRRCEYCQPCPQGVIITPAMTYPVITHRMPLAIAIGMTGKALDTVPKCVECGVCVTRCPYQLPIPEMIKKNYETYLKDRENLKA